MTEDHLGKRGTTSRVVDDLSDNSLNITVSLGVVQSSELGGTLAVGSVRLEDATSSLPLTWWSELQASKSRAIHKRGK
jgi:hypothetical protein